MEDAKRDGDQVHAVITDCHLSCDEDLQTAVLAAFSNHDSHDGGNIRAARIETSFSGRRADQSLTTDALQQVFGRSFHASLPGNSIARQFGNLSGASGMASLLKTILQLKGPKDEGQPLPKTHSCVANAVLFLASPLSDLVQAETLTVDGGAGVHV